MKRYLITLCKNFLFWMLFFALGRAIFLLFNINSLNNINVGEVLLTFVHALRLDLSTTCYIMSIPFILMTFQLITNKNWLNKLIKIYMAVLVIASSIAILTDICLYHEWDFKLNYKAIYYLQNPAEIMRSATIWEMVFVILGTMVLFTFSYYIYDRFISEPRITKKSKFYWQSALCLIIGSGFIFIGMRGGVSQVPISQSASYFSKHQLLNDAAVNPEWNLLCTTIKFSRLNNVNPFVRMDETEAEKLVKELYTIKQDSCLKVLKTTHPNIVIILLESWSADLIESLGGKPGITPYFKELEKEGLLFTKTYSNGHRSQQGISAVLNGFPPIPINVLTDNFEKFSKLNSINKDLKKKNYTSSFYFGGDLVYGNIKAFLMSNEFDRIIDEKDFAYNTPHGKLSIFDNYTFERQLSDLSNEKEPFFSMLFTATTHSPYDEPKDVVDQINWKVSEVPYLNSAKYTDYYLGKYFEQAKKEGWYDNTLFILIADHSHRTYNQWSYHSAEYQHIPMLWLGGALKNEFRGKQIDKLCSQIDIPYSILRQLDIYSDSYKWSNDILNPYSGQFVPVETTVGLNWIRPNGFIYYDGFKNESRVSGFENDSVRNQEILYNKAFLQYLYETYLNY